MRAGPLPGPNRPLTPPPRGGLPAEGFGDGLEIGSGTGYFSLNLMQLGLIERLTELHGVGQWTVEMLLIFTLGRRNATERMASFLLHLRDQQRIDMAEEPAPAQPWQIPMTRTDIADYLGLTIETVSRVLSRLKARGILRLPTLHSFEIVNEPALIAAAGDD